jgi:hypothetical protein
MKRNEALIVTPEPFFRIDFNCSNRAFYQVKSELYQIGESVGIEPQDGYMGESCDYEGDLEEIRLYRDDRSKEFVQAVLKFYDVDAAEVPEDMAIVLCI